jgi:1-acyl-sn-glycerol-3-phosphate acyltransferase
VLSQAILRLLSWQFVVNRPPGSKYVLVGAHHTSGWDLFYALLFKYATGIDFKFVAKDDLFRWPVGGLLRWFGGVPVNRRSRTGFVQQMVDIFNQSEAFILVISPEGTRSKSKYWKTGFYYIALGAKVPIGMVFLDYKEKIVGIGPNFMPSGDIEADFVQIRDFFSGIQGRRPEAQGEIAIRPKDQN